MNEIKVHVVKYRDRANLMMRYEDPMTGKQIARSTGASKKREAEKIAAKWEAELQEGRYSRSEKMPWAEFRQHYEDTIFQTIKLSTAHDYASTLNVFESLCRPNRLCDLNTAKVTAFATELRKERKRKRKDGSEKTTRMSEASVAKHLRQLKAAANWAHRQDLLPKVPRFDIPRKSSGAQRMKGRPITLEEFERMLMASERIVEASAAESWKLLLRGLWATGLRLGECINLRWDYQPGEPAVVLDGKHSVIAFDADSQKSGKVQHMPLAPEAVELLEPFQRSNGYVFHPIRPDGKPIARSTLRIGKTISAIGAAAGVVTDAAKGQTATAHDLRRAFGSRWSKLVMPATLKELMRHSSIETTMTYYVQQCAKTTAGELWAARGNISGNTQSTGARVEQKTP